MSLIGEIEVYNYNYYNDVTNKRVEVEGDTMERRKHTLIHTCK